jgi:serine/threonine-protein kinase
VVSIGTLMLAKPAPAWDDETLRTAEHELARALGPMARLIVRRAAAQTFDRSELCAILSDTISDPESRHRFVTAFNKAGGGQGSTGTSGMRSGSGTIRTTSPGTKTSATVAAALEPAYVAHVATQLAIHIGPIAQVLVKKAARDSRTRAEFVRRCADNLGTQERSAFLHELGYE